jgi:NADPH-dependent glutamate synthase beta subunit-like oxidoreductase
MAQTHPYRSCVAVIGGATAGAEAADKLAASGALCVVFEQNDRPYGKVEDGLPRWHAALRRKEYDLIDSKLARDGVLFVPRTGIGRDISFSELVEQWGFDTIVLANGAWRDRPFPVPGADAYVNRGLVYQNPFIYWFNHYREPGYRGPRYEICEDAAVIGGGLASIDVVKVLQLETTCRALEKRGIAADLIEMEVDGIPETLARHGLSWADLGVEPCTLYYRRRIEDMPLAEAPEKATPEQISKSENVRRRILEKAQAKYLFRIEPLTVPTGLVTDGDRLIGLRLARTRIDASGRAVVVPGEEREIRTGLVISSIGSIPEPIEGLKMDGELLRLESFDHGKVAEYEHVFGCGNVVTGKGNLVASRKHSAKVAAFLAAQPDPAHDGEDRARVVERLVQLVRDRQRSVGFDGDYRSWIARVKPEGLA